VLCRCRRLPALAASDFSTSGSIMLLGWALPVQTRGLQQRQHNIETRVTLVMILIQPYLWPSLLQNMSLLYTAMNHVNYLSFRSLCNTHLKNVLL
jgi:hypothetical protein